MLTRLPAAPSGLWDWCLTQDAATLIELLTFCAALAVDARVTKVEPGTSARHRAADRLAGALAVDPAKWCDLASLRLFERATKDYAADVVRQHISSGRAERCRRMKKAEAERYATDALNGKWLPPELSRTACGACADTDADPLEESDVFEDCAEAA